MLAGASPRIAYCADDVRAAITLARGALRVGSHIDVFRYDRFWEAVIVGVRKKHFRFRFLHTGRQREFGCVMKRDFLRSWRFPVRSESDAWSAEVVAEFASDGEDVFESVT